jgi:prepilin-type N-terminal cleavage/methylation domain-containing protein
MTTTASQPARPVRPGFTLVELLVVIAIIGVLVGLTIPAVQYAREQSRKATCKNNLKQIYLANQSFMGLYNKFPSGGWGFGWVGDPKQPVGKRQPGGFFYSILPYMERQGLYQMSKDETDPATVDALQYQMVNEYIPTFTCPSRRDAKAFEAVPKTDWTADWLANAGQATPPTWYRSDYSVNGGTVQVLWDYGPANAAQAKNEYSDPTYMNRYKYQNATTGVNGIAHQYSEITTQDIFDGASNTYLVGEKYLNGAHYTDGVDTRDDHPAYGGDVRDLFSFADGPARRDGYDTAAAVSPLIFGSVHDGTLHMAMCDGAVNDISYDIDLAVHAQNANRRDSRP